MAKYRRLVNTLRKVMRPIQRQVAIMRLPDYIRYDEHGAVLPEDQEAAAAAVALGVTMKEYIVDEEWNPDMDGVDP